MHTTVELIEQQHIARVVFRSEKGIQILSHATRSALDRVLSRLDDLHDCRVVIFEAEGRSFLAGADLSELKSLTPKTAFAFAREGQELMNRIESLEPATIAAIHAPCVGGGCELALACDFRMAAVSARIGLPEVSLGVIPGWGGTVRGVRLLGSAAARRLILTAELQSAADALAVGLVDSVHADDQFRQAVAARAGLLVSRAPFALRRAKRLVHSLEARSAARQFRREARRFAACYRNGEPTEGIAAFLEKREPAWKSVPNPPPEPTNGAPESTSVE